MNEAQLAAVVDRNAIIDTLNRYATGIDTRNEALYRSCFTDDLVVDMFGDGAKESTADQWVETALNAVSSFETTQHIITNHVIETDGDRATCVAYLLAQHWNPDNYFRVGGYYSHELVRDGDRWLMSRIKLTITWNQFG